jgi:hypothetical protein
MNRSVTQVLFTGRRQVTPIDLYLSISSEGISHAHYYLLKYGINKSEFVQHLQKHYKGAEYTTKLSDTQAEEFLAEEFRNFMLVGKDNYRFGSDNIKRNVFERFWEALLKFFGVRSNGTIEDLFNKVSSSTFRMSDRVNFKDYELNRVGKFDEETTNAVMGWMSYNLFDLLEKNTKHQEKYTKMTLF